MIDHKLRHELRIDLVMIYWALLHSGGRPFVKLLIDGEKSWTSGILSLLSNVSHVFIHDMSKTYRKIVFRFNPIIPSSNLRAQACVKHSTDHMQVQWTSTNFS